VRAVVYHEHIREVLTHLLDDRANGGWVVVRRDHDARTKHEHGEEPLDAAF
jgi:hypothetical protein